MTRPKRKSEFLVENLEGRATPATVFPAVGQVAADVSIIPATAPDADGNLVVPVTVKGTASIKIARRGEYTFEATHDNVLSGATGFSTGTNVRGRVVFTAKNGDKLRASYEGPGTRNQSGGFSDTLQFRVIGGTGRFRGVIGRGTIDVSDVPTSPTTFVLSGTVNARLIKK